MKPTESMPAELCAECKAVVDRVIAGHDNDATQLVGILLDIQLENERHYISQATAVYVAQKLGIKVTQVYDVMCFYTAIHDTPQAKFTLEVCNSAPCQVNGSASLLDMLQEKLGLAPGEMSADGVWSVQKVPCFGACDVAPAVRCNGTVYGGLTDQNKVAALLQKLEGGAR